MNREEIAVRVLIALLGGKSPLNQDNIVSYAISLTDKLLDGLKETEPEEEGEEEELYATRGELVNAISKTASLTLEELVSKLREVGINIHSSRKPDELEVKKNDTSRELKWMKVTHNLDLSIYALFGITAICFAVAAAVILIKAIL